MPAPADQSHGAKAQRLAARLRQLRTSRGLTQEALAQATGVTRNHYQLLESGTSPDGRPSNPRLSTLVALADALDVAVEDLIE